MPRVTKPAPTQFRQAWPTAGRAVAWLVVAGSTAAALSLVGCGTGDPAASEIAADAAKAPPPAPAPAPAAPAEKNDFAGSKSVLGKAMEQAHKLEDKVEAYNKKIEDAAEGKHE